MNQKKILVVDDDPIIIRTTSSLLAANGYGVINARDGGSAVEKARTEHPDLILLDMLFPPDVAHGGGIPWDGFLIVNWLRRIDEAKDIPIVFLTSTDPALYQVRAAALGVKACLGKPVDKKELLSVVAQLLSGARSEPQKPALNGKRILFVDDEGDWREMVGMYLKEAGFEVLTARDVAETFHRSQKSQLDAIVLDVNLAGENSALLMELLKQSHPGVPIIVHTGLDQHDDAVQTMLKQGAHRYLRKGTLGELTEAIQKAVN
jgi:CheY-like chemotaxis protein